MKRDCLNLGIYARYHSSFFGAGGGGGGREMRNDYSVWVEVEIEDKKKRIKTRK